MRLLRQEKTTKLSLSLNSVLCPARCKPGSGNATAMEKRSIGPATRAWMDALERRAHRSVLIVAFANKLASNVALRPFRFNISPGYLKAAGTTLLAIRDSVWRDDKSALVPALVNRQFAVRMFGSMNVAMVKHFRIGVPRA